MTVKEDKVKRVEKLKEIFGDRLMFVIVSGSRSYGTEVKESDLDLRGVVIDPEDSVFGLNNFEQYENKEDDTVIYSLKKYLKLIKNSNPNMIEYLGVEDEDIVYISDLGKLIFDNQEMYLSKGLSNKFFGYARSLENRLENALKKGHINDTNLCKEINKLSMNIIRVLNMGTDILNGKGIITKRPEAETLKDIRSGKYLIQEENLKLTNEYLDILKEAKAKFKEAEENTKLPKKLDLESIDKLCIELLKTYYKM